VHFSYKQRIPLLSLASWITLDIKPIFWEGSQALHGG
jgi:hypothetical protein